jgi:hypothetical protein
VVTVANGEQTAELSTHCRLVVDALLKGRVVPFLGAGVNLCDRPSGAVWNATDGKYLPKGWELAEHLAERFHYPVSQANLGGCPDPTSHLDLARVSQYGATLMDEGPLYDELRAVFRPRFVPTAVHTFLAGLRSPQPERIEDSHPLLATTNYDDLMEQALGKGNFDLVFYDADAQPRPIFWHEAPGVAAQQIENPPAYAYEFFKDRPVVLKVHGTIDRANAERESFVITEDQYIEYLSEEPMEKLLPPRLLQKMREKHHLLFLGYSLRDWNFRVFLRHLKRNARQRYRSWAVLLGADEVEKRFWEQNGVDIVNVDLRTYVDALQQELDSRQTGRGTAPVKADG